MSELTQEEWDTAYDWSVSALLSGFPEKLDPPAESISRRARQVERHQRAKEVAKKWITDECGERPEK